MTYTGSSGPVKVTGNAINLAGTSILTAINGDYAVQGKDSGLAVGLWSSNTGEGSQNTFQASFDDILITSTGPTGQLVKAVNVGGGQVTASNGIVFQADAGPTTGAAASQVFSTTAGISGTTDDALYQNERWTPGGSYTYEVPVANGTYQVDLLLAEIYSGITGPGQRVFDMSLEGQALAALQNIDIYAQVGANAAYTITQQVTVNDGSLSIQVGPGSSSPGNVENAKLNAFAVYTAGAAPPPSPTLAIAAANASQNEGNSGSTAFTFTVTRTGSTTGASTASYAVTGSGANPATAADFTGGVFPTGTVSFAAGETGKTITVNVAGDSTVEPGENFTVTLSNPSAGTTIGTAAATGTILNDDGATTPTLVKAVNVGGGQVTASNGIVFQADAGPTTGAAASQVFSTTAGIAGTTDDALYQNERWTPGGSYTYEIAVANGTYQVDLLLAEIYSGITGPGSARVRHVAGRPGAGGAAEHRHLRPGRRQRRLHDHPAGDGERRLAVDPGRTRQLVAGQCRERQAQRLRGVQHGGAALADAVDRGGQCQPERGQQRQHRLHLHGDAHRQHDGRLDGEPLP